MNLIEGKISASNYKFAIVQNRFNEIICIGAVIRGATPHFEYISSSVANGISQTALKHGVPIIFGVLTTDTVEQAIERSGTKSGNKGWDAALTAIEMADFVPRSEEH